MRIYRFKDLKSTRSGFINYTERQTEKRITEEKNQGILYNSQKGKNEENVREELG